MHANAEHPVRARLIIRGAVQGVGFRPCVYRLAMELGLKGWVNNSGQGVFVELEGPRVQIDRFIHRLEAEKPPRSSIQSFETVWLDPAGYRQFDIRPSDDSGPATALILPDIAICEDCRREIFDPANRRHLYPFTNCTNCGPRFSIIEALPYDRGHTSMKKFPMCEQCCAEYEDPRDRRFHAQPNACPVCGPQVELWTDEGHLLEEKHNAINAAAVALRKGSIVAVKGLGGFHLMVDARDEEAVRRLRERKHREEKPLAVMFPDLDAVRNECEISPLEKRLLTSPESPIVLLRRKSIPPDVSGRIAASVAPNNPYLGAMLPYTPLHHILLAQLHFPLVATSGNFTDEPICTDEMDAVRSLAGIADLFLVHNRPIVRHIDDSIIREMAGREQVFRRARGYAPLPVFLPKPLPPILGVGSHLKNTIALSVGSQVFISQHIGDLETASAVAAFYRVIKDLEHMYGVNPEIAAADTHPDYVSTAFARSTKSRVISVQHHAAHIYSCLAENHLEPPALGVAWDGTGYGLDGTVWGGEFLKMKASGFDRFAHFRNFGLPGGDVAAREPRRSALGVLYEIFGPAVFDMKKLAPLQAFKDSELATLGTMLQKKVNVPLTSSAGRLFDAVASLLDLRQKTSFEGQAAMEMEFAIKNIASDRAYPFRHDNGMIDWEPMVREIIEDLGRNLSVSEIAVTFHNTLAEIIVSTARVSGEKRVALSGGCFQNKYLTERAIRRLREEGMSPYWHQRVPANDGGIALGQVVAAGGMLG
ncbi:MAG: carbamoyltransferase HypF [Methylacidiphilales bacterium]|nr:carbamoyltransferase HypF [Candidatus Methylacidiphilales bacterium]